MLSVVCRRVSENMNKRKAGHNSKFDWRQAVNIEAATNSARSEQFGDWFRDPWGWPELNYVALNSELVISRLANGRSRFESLDIPKTNFGTRPAVIQDPTDRVAYHALVGSISKSVSKGLHQNVCGWRLSRKEPVAGQYRNNRREWALFCKKRREFGNKADTLLVTDITNFFASIPLDNLVSTVESKVRSNAVVQTLTEVLSTYNTIATRAGVPQRSTASSLLANIYLRSIDELLIRYSTSRNRHRWLRWMDDIWIFGGSYEELRNCQLDLQDELRSIGLEINLGKTHYLEGHAVSGHISNLELGRNDTPNLSIASGEYGTFDFDMEEIEDLLSGIMDDPACTDRTVYSYVCNRLGRNGILNWMEDLADTARSAPHAADHFSRLFARNGYWSELDEWWVDFASSSIGRNHLTWAVAQLGTMFPSAEGVDVVADFLCEQLEDGANISLELAALAAHRLPYWRPGDAASLLREFCSQTYSPLGRRLGAIALYNLGENMQRIRSILGEFEENRGSLAMLEARRGKRIPDSDDFDIASYPSMHA